MKKIGLRSVKARQSFAFCFYRDTQIATEGLVLSPPR
jgi:hypothetical protein